MPNTKEKGKLIEVLSKHIPYGHATLCLIAEELMAEGATFATDNNVGDKWISVKDRLPERFVYVLVMTDFGESAVARLKGNGRWYIAWDNDQYAGITHWMPLPQPPKGE